MLYSNSQGDGLYSLSHCMVKLEFVPVYEGLCNEKCLANLTEKEHDLLFEDVFLDP